MKIIEEQFKHYTPRVDAIKAQQLRGERDDDGFKINGFVAPNGSWFVDVGGTRSLIAPDLFQALFRPQPEKQIHEIEEDGDA